MQDTILIIDNELCAKLHAKINEMQEKIRQHAFLPCAVEEAVRKVSCPESMPSVALIELGGEKVEIGLKAISGIKSVRPELPVIALVPYGEEKMAIRALEAGAHDFLIKPVPLDKLRLSLQHALMIRRMKSYIMRLEHYTKELDHLQSGRPVPSANPLGSLLLDEKGHIKPLKSVEKDIIRFVLHHTNGCMARAARSLGIGRSTLYRKVQELDMQPYMARENQTIRPAMVISPKMRSSAE